MSRQAPHIRDAGPEDAAELLQLWAEAARSGANSLRAQDDAERALANLAAASDERLLVAESDGRIVGGDEAEPWPHLAAGARLRRTHLVPAGAAASSVATASVAR